jgi:hypothetical protein
MSYQQRYADSPKGKFIRQRANARRRCIPWHFTFEEWWDLWEKSGKWNDRGIGAGQYMMCRKGDIGEYSTENVEIKSNSENAKERWDVRRTPLKDPFEPYPRTTAWDYSWSKDRE